MDQQKAAVLSGHVAALPLRPRAGGGRKEPSLLLGKYVYNETRYTTFAQSDPVAAK